MVEALVKLMATGDDVTGPINLGNPSEFTILQLAQTVVAMTGSSSKIVFRSLPSDDPVQRQPDIGLAKRLLGWSPSVELEKGLKETIGYFQKLLRKGPE
jgi:UDP-glucuronate decarboxylase